MICRIALMMFVAALARVGFSSEGPDFSKLAERWTAAAKELEVTGLSAVIVNGNDVAFTYVYGTRAPKDETPITPATPFYIASSTKPFTAMGIVILAEDGKLNIDDPVSKHLPQFKLRDPDLTAKITLRDLMSHRYGINSSPIVWLDAYTGQITDEKFFELLETASVNGSFAYTNLHFTILGRVIESVSGKPWQQFLEERIFIPAGMKHMTASASRLYGEFNGALPAVYNANGRELSPFPKDDSVMHAAGGMGSSADDLARWIMLNMNGGAIEDTRIISEASTREMQKVQVTIPDPPRGAERTAVGLGWMLGEYGGAKTVHHHGGYIGASARILFFPEKKWGIAVLNNDTGPASALPDVIMDDFSDLVTGTKREDDLPKLIADGKKWREERKQREMIVPSDNHVKNLSKPIERYAGIYESDIHGTLEIQAEGDRLKAEIGNLKLGLQNDGTDQFKANVFGSIELLRFRFGDDGQANLAILGPKIGTIRRFKRR